MSKLTDAMTHLQKTTREYEECVESCQYDAGYFCSRQRVEMEEAEEEFLDALMSALMSRADKAGKVDA